VTGPKASPPPAEKADIEEGTAFSPRFDANGLVPVVVTSAVSGEVLMLAYMNDEALARTIETGEAQFWSRSRKRLWRKGEESGNTLAVADIRVDCDQDAVLLKVRVAGDGIACHTGYRSCFYRSVPAGRAPTPDLALVFDRSMPRK